MDRQEEIEETEESSCDISKRDRKRSKPACGHVEGNIDATLSGARNAVDLQGRSGKKGGCDESSDTSVNATDRLTVWPDTSSSVPRTVISTKTRSGRSSDSPSPSRMYSVAFRLVPLYVEAVPIRAARVASKRPAIPRASPRSAPHTRRFDARVAVSLEELCGRDLLIGSRSEASPSMFWTFRVLRKPIACPEGSCSKAPAKSSPVQMSNAP